MKKFKLTNMLAFIIAGLLLTLTLPVHAQVLKPGLSLRFIPDIYYRDLNAGKDNIVYLEVGNYGTTTVNNIRLRADVPAKWIVDISPAQIAAIDNGGFQTVNVNIVPPADADNNEYNITIIAEANETQSAISAVVRIDNATSRWLWIGLAIAGALIAGFISIYRKFGRD